MSKSLYCLSITLLASFSISAMFNEKITQIQQENLFVPQSLGKIDLYHDDKGFSIVNDYGITKIKPYNVDKELRGISQKDLAKLITAKSYISVKELNYGEDYSLKLNHRINGGGLIGAWLGSTLGYGMVFFGGQALIYGTTFWCPPLHATVVKMTAIPLHSAACAAGVAGGATLGSITGPV